MESYSNQKSVKLCTVLHRAITTWNSIPHQVTDASSRFRLLFFLHKNTPFGTAGNRHTSASIRTLHTCTLQYGGILHFALQICSGVILLYDVLFYLLFSMQCNCLNVFETQEEQLLPWQQIMVIPNKYNKAAGIKQSVK